MWDQWVQVLLHQGALMSFHCLVSSKCFSLSSVQSLSLVWLLATLWTESRQASLPITIFQSFFKIMCITLIMPSNHLILCCPLLLLLSIFPCIKVFSSESVLHTRWPKYWSFSFSICPSNEYSELISFSMDLLDLLVVQGTLKSLVQHHSSKPSVLHYSPFFMLQLSHPYVTTGKNSFDYTEFFYQSNAFAFKNVAQFVITFF